MEITLGSPEVRLKVTIKRDRPLCEAFDRAHALITDKHAEILDSIPGQVVW